MVWSTDTSIQGRVGEWGEFRNTDAAKFYLLNLKQFD